MGFLRAGPLAGMSWMRMGTEGRRVPRLWVTCRVVMA